MILTSKKIKLEIQEKMFALRKINKMDSKKINMRTFSIHKVVSYNFISIYIFISFSNLIYKYLYGWDDWPQLTTAGQSTVPHPSLKNKIKSEKRDL